MPGLAERRGAGVAWGQAEGGRGIEHPNPNPNKNSVTEQWTGSWTLENSGCDGCPMRECVRLRYISPLSLSLSLPTSPPRPETFIITYTRSTRWTAGIGEWGMGGRECGSRAASRNRGGPCTSRVCISMRRSSRRFVSNVTQFACCLISVMLYTYTYTMMPEANVCY